ncbi:MAG: cytochrome c-type biogenesis protein [Actinomycetota bacterium]
MRRRVLVLVGAATVVVAAAWIAAARPDRSATLEDRVQAIASGLRCPVCQNLSVADSPSRLAGEMRGEIGAQLRDGRTDEQVRAFFVTRYGDWVLLDPPRRGLNLLPWAFPLAAVVAGLAVWAAVVRRRPGGEARDVSDDDRRRIARELSELKEIP